MQKTDKIWRNGSFVSWDDAQVHVLTHALHYGTGVFEGIRAYETPKGAAVFRLTDHLERLRRSASLYEMDLGYSVPELAAVVHETVALNEVPSCYVRPIVFRGYGEMGLDPRKNPGRRGGRGVAVGRLPRRGRPRARRALQGVELSAGSGQIHCRPRQRRRGSTSTRCWPSSRPAAVVTTRPSS